MLPEHGDAEAVAAVRRRDIATHRLEVATLERASDPGGARHLREDVDDPTHGPAAPDAGAAAANDLDAVDEFEWHRGPVHPTGERIGDRHAVDQHERAARRRATTDAAQRRSLARGMRRHGRLIIAQRESRNGAQEIGGRLSRRRVDRRRGQYGDVRRHVAQRLSGARHADHDLPERQHPPGVGTGRGRLRRRGGRLQ